jgi:hypothetical protein
MKPRYAVVDKEERDKFEREYQMPYGYGNIPIYFDLGKAINFRNKLTKKCIIEEYDNGTVREVPL